ncbi:14316_t:CDS:2 [Cetraspora pellucida]|uniref:14316_t:CDS:1 n=1 Tax=Cetraspora pellucida TaxID=1433469 RepID=A0A9N9AAZ4_9GLOM|nr:14316_t:CDS:2 [Cetraspora pellucida]
MIGGNYLAAAANWHLILVCYKIGPIIDYREFKNKKYVREGTTGEIYKVERITNEKTKRKPSVFALKGFKGDPEEFVELNV